MTAPSCCMPASTSATKRWAQPDGVRIVDLPVVEVASVVHRGPMDTVVAVYAALVRWIEDSGYRLDGRSRELYHEWHPEDPARSVTELQMPVALAP